MILLNQLMKPLLNITTTMSTPLCLLPELHLKIVLSHGCRGVNAAQLAEVFKLDDDFRPMTFNNLDHVGMNVHVSVF